MLTVVLGLELDRRDVVQAAVQPAGVEPVHPALGGGLEVVDAPPRSLALGALGLVEPDQAFGLGIVVRITDGADRGDRSRVKSLSEY